MENKPSYTSSVALRRLMDDINGRPVEDLICSTGTVYGKEYFTVEPNGGSWFEMESWCVSTFGSAGNVWYERRDVPHPNYRWYLNNRKFWFRDEADRTMFLMRWR